MALNRPRFRYLAIEGTWYRLVRRGRDALDFERTRMIGGRYNPPGSFPTIYFGEHPSTCLLEVLVHADELPDEYDLFAVEVRLSRAVDLWSGPGRRAAGVSLEELTAPPRPIASEQGAILGTSYGVTWDIGKLAWARDAEGLVALSAALPVERVLIVFERSRIGLTIREGQPARIDPRMRRLFGPRRG